MIKGIFQQDHIMLVNIYALNMGGRKYIKQILMEIKGEDDRNTVIVRDFNTPLTSMDRSSRQKIKKETVTLNNTPTQMDLIEISEHFTPKEQNIHTFQVHMECFLG